ncbi:UbiA prenyltransferase family-domain-containing protein [Ganoderma leucocontextum]|nr:UbiA prenyltransferase family-domain-containing protein [Ganoderma leucocontextum]
MGWDVRQKDLRASLVPPRRSCSVFFRRPQGAHSREPLASMLPPLISVAQPRVSLAGRGDPQLRVSFAGRRDSPMRPLSSSLIMLLRWCSYHSRTAVLFTASDFKTILFPICAFACATAPLYSLDRLLLGVMWVWTHQFMCNVSNQARGRVEDAVNKPWRPLPAGRITEHQAFVLRWVTVAACFACSALHGLDLVLTTLAMFLTTFAYDELNLSGHYLGKSFCNIGGYTTFEIGATKLMGATRDLDTVSLTAVCISGALIFTTIQAQDFADVEGDAALGRKTFPIYAPRASRVATLLAMCAWSLFLACFWGVGPLCGAAFVAFGSFVGCRFYFLRTAEEDTRSYVLYNIWLTLVHIMPLHARTGLVAL